MIHSSAPLAIDPAFVLAAIHVDQTAEQRHVAPALVESARAQIAASAPALAVSTTILEGTPQDAIVEEARAWDADVIVLGSHGDGRLKRLVLGSVAGAVVANASCSVQLVRARHLLRQTESAA